MARLHRIDILDTHVWLWLMEGDPRLGEVQVDELERAASVGELCVTTLSLWEVAEYEAAGRVRLVVPVETWLREALDTPGLNLIDIDEAIATESSRLPGEFAGDAVDRMLVASARTRGGRIYTADPTILEYAEAGHVEAVRVG